MHVAKNDVDATTGNGGIFDGEICEVDESGEKDGGETAEGMNGRERLKIEGEFVGEANGSDGAVFK